MFIRTHLDNDGNLCPPLQYGETRVLPVPKIVESDQLTLFR